jgi:NADH:ubiquinone oxidoreductase subunit C
MPDATGLELVAQRVRDAVGEDVVVDTLHAHGQATLQVAPDSVHDVLAHLRDADEEPYTQLTSVHARSRGWASTTSC